MARIAVLYLAHKLTESLVRRLRSLRAECDGTDHDLTLLFDATHSPCPELPGIPVHSFDVRSIEALGFHMLSAGRNGPGIVPGNTDYPVLSYYLSHPAYNFYWLIEHDVRFTGSWRDFFAACDTSRADLLTTTIETFYENEYWFWWRSLGFRGTAPDRMEVIRAYLPIYRLSECACRLLVRECRDGWRGHFEARLPTILRRNKLVLEDIGGEGSFVPEGNENRFYIGANPRTPQIATLQWRPVLREPGSLPNKLWHPVKET